MLRDLSEHRCYMVHLQKLCADEGQDTHSTPDLDRPLCCILALLQVDNIVPLQGRLCLTKFVCIYILHFVERS